MPNQQITTTIVSIILWIFSAFATLIFRKIFEPHIPERKKLILYIRNLLFFIVAYASPISFIIYLMATTTVVDKYFVLGIAYNFFALAINFSSYLQRMTHKSFIQLSDLTHNALIGMSDAIKSTYPENIGIHSESISEIFKLMRGLNDLQNILHKRLMELENENEKRKKEKKKP